MRSFEVVWTRLSSHASTEKNQPTTRLLAVLLVLSVGCGSPTKLVCYQWPFQDPKLEVPTIYKAYVMGISHDSLLVIANTSGYPFMGLPLHQPSSSCRGPLEFSRNWRSRNPSQTGSLCSLPLLICLGSGGFPWAHGVLPSWYLPNTFSTRDVLICSGFNWPHPLGTSSMQLFGSSAKKKTSSFENLGRRDLPGSNNEKNIWSIFPKDWPTLREMNGTSTIGNQIYILKCKFSLQPIN